MRSSITLSTVLIFLFFLTSCTKDFLQHEVDQNAIFPSTPEAKETAALLQEVGAILPKIYRNPEVIREVNAAIYSGFDKDESISIIHLLTPSTSKLYQSDAFIKRPVKFGTFAAEFKKEYANGNYPLLSKYYGSVLSSGVRDANGGMVSSNAEITPPMEMWRVNNVQIYFPYSENFSSTYDPGAAGQNTPTGTVFVTLVTADREADMGPGREPYKYKVTPETGGLYWEIRWLNVTVNDAYAEVKATHIARTQDVPDPVPPVTPPVTNVRIHMVYIGWIKARRQFDNFISITGNSGGSELRFGRGYVSVASNGQVAGGFPFVHHELTRKQIRKETWVQVMKYWDTDWTVDKLEQGLGIYEDDTEGSKTISIPVSYTANGQTYGATASTTVASKDAIIANVGLGRNFYFSQGTVDRGWGFQGGWPVNDGLVSYTMPYQIVN